MLTINTDVKKVFVYDTVNAWGITENENEAKQADSTYRLAAIDDLNILVALCGQLFEGKLLTKDGIVEWYEEGGELNAVTGDYECGYRFFVDGMYINCDDWIS